MKHLIVHDSVASSQKAPLKPSDDALEAASVAAQISPDVRRDDGSRDDEATTYLMFMNVLINAYAVDQARIVEFATK